MLIMDGGDCTDGKRQGFNLYSYVKPCGAYGRKCTFFVSAFYPGHEVRDHLYRKALLRSLNGYRYAFLHFRRLLT